MVKIHPRKPRVELGNIVTLYPRSDMRRPDIDIVLDIGHRDVDLQWKTKELGQP